MVKGMCGMDSAGDNCCSESALLCFPCTNAPHVVWSIYTWCMVCVVVDAWIIFHLEVEFCLTLRPNLVDDPKGQKCNRRSILVRICGWVK